MGPERSGVDPKVVEPEEDERKAQAEIERLTNGELARELAKYREVGMTLRKGIYEMVRQAEVRAEWEGRVTEAVEKGGIPDWQAERPYPDDPASRGWQAPKIEAKEVWGRMQAREKDYRLQTGGDEEQLKLVLEHLNGLAQTYNLHFFMNNGMLIDALRARQGPQTWKTKLGDYQSLTPDQYIFQVFDDAVRARLWELTTPEGVPRR